MTAIAAHRGWRSDREAGTPGFRREAWLASRTLGLEVKGYAPTARDLQELDRRRANRERLEAHLADLAKPPSGRGDRLDGAADRLRHPPNPLSGPAYRRSLRLQGSAWGRPPRPAPEWPHWLEQGVILSPA